MHHVRFGQWETNSSSCHEIIINGGDENYQIPKKVKLYTDEYGWSFFCYRKVDARLSYLITVLACNVDSRSDFAKDKDGKPIKITIQDFDNFIEYIKDFLKKNGVETIEDELKPVDDSDHWVSKIENCHNLYGYVDHEDDYLERVYNIIHDEKLLYDFLFNGRSFVITGNDNGFTEYDAPKGWDIDRELKNCVY